MSSHRASSDDFNPLYLGQNQEEEKHELTPLNGHEVGSTSSLEHQHH